MIEAHTDCVMGLPEPNITQYTRQVPIGLTWQHTRSLIILHVCYRENIT